MTSQPTRIAPAAIVSFAQASAGLLEAAFVALPELRAYALGRPVRLILDGEHRIATIAFGPFESSDVPLLISIRCNPEAPDTVGAISEHLVTDGRAITH